LDVKRLRRHGLANVEAGRLGSSRSLAFNFLG
jgi:hypothetical protein